MIYHLCHVILKLACHDQGISILKSDFPKNPHAELSIFSKGQKIWT
jgi:hypothetical protein